MANQTRPNDAMRVLSGCVTKAEAQLRVVFKTAVLQAKVKELQRQLDTREVIGEEFMAKNWELQKLKEELRWARKDERQHWSDFEREAIKNTALQAENEKLRDERDDWKKLATNHARELTEIRAENEKLRKGNWCGGVK